MKKIIISLLIINNLFSMGHDHRRTMRLMHKQQQVKNPRSWQRPLTKESARVDPIEHKNEYLFGWFNNAHLDKKLLALAFCTLCITTPLCAYKHKQNVEKQYEESLKNSNMCQALVGQDTQYCIDPCIYSLPWQAQYLLDNSHSSKFKRLPLKEKEQILRELNQCKQRYDLQREDFLYSEEAQEIPKEEWDKRAQILRTITTGLDEADCQGFRMLMLDSQYRGAIAERHEDVEVTAIRLNIQ